MADISAPHPNQHWGQPTKAPSYFSDPAQPDSPSLQPLIDASTSESALDGHRAIQSILEEISSDEDGTRFLCEVLDLLRTQAILPPNLWGLLQSLFHHPDWAQVQTHVMHIISSLCRSSHDGSEQQPHSQAATTYTTPAPSNPAIPTLTVHNAGANVPTLSKLDTSFDRGRPLNNRLTVPSNESGRRKLSRSPSPQHWPSDCNEHDSQVRDTITCIAKDCDKPFKKFGSCVNHVRLCHQSLAATMETTELKMAIRARQQTPSSAARLSPSPTGLPTTPINESTPHSVSLQSHYSPGGPQMNRSPTPYVPQTYGSSPRNLQGNALFPSGGSSPLMGVGHNIMFGQYHNSGPHSNLPAEAGFPMMPSPPYNPLHAQNAYDDIPANMESQQYGPPNMDSLSLFPNIDQSGDSAPTSGSHRFKRNLSTNDANESDDFNERPSSKRRRT